MHDTKLQIICRDLDYCEEINSTIRHILVPYDNSAYSNRAFVYALDLPKKYGAKLSVISIMYSSFNPTDIRHQTTVDDKKSGLWKNHIGVYVKLRKNLEFQSKPRC